MFAGAWAYLVDVGVSHPGQRPANVHSRHWLLASLLRLKRGHGTPRCLSCQCNRLHTCSPMEPWQQVLLSSMGKWGCSPMHRSIRKRRKPVLGCLLLCRRGTVNLSNSVARLVHTDCFHMGRLRVHVHRSHASHTTPHKAQETVETTPYRDSIVHRDSIDGCMPHDSASPLLGFKFAKLLRTGCACLNICLSTGQWVWEHGLG